MNASLLLWGLLLGYGLVMWLIAPRTQRFDGFFQGHDSRGRDVGLAFLVASVVISWIFAKSITNAANLGFKYGLVGAVAYAGWYVSIPVAGFVIYRLRTRWGVRSLPEFLVSRHGRGAALAFMLVILVRLMNEVWSNTAVVGAYFGASGSTPYFVAALVFGALTLAYSLRGGLRSSIFTDLIQFGLGIFLLVFVLALIVPRSGAAPLVSSGDWTLRGGVDLLLVAVLQSFSYPFHDPVLTDRAFITRPRVMLTGYLLAGLLAAAFIVVFGLVGVFGRVEGIGAGQDAPIQVARAFGVAMLAGMSGLMMISAGSTLDSTLSSFSKAVVVDLGGAGSSSAPGASGRVVSWITSRDPVSVGRRVMIAAVILGSLPLFSGAAIIKATTVSGTMVLGLAPVFLLHGWRGAGRWAFHLALWPGAAVGVLHALNRIPAAWNVGDGPYAGLLGANLVGTLAVFTGFILGVVLDRMGGRVPARAAASGALLVVLGGASLAEAGDPGAAGTEARPAPSISLSGQTMFRLTWKLRDLDRPSAEVYNIRLRGAARDGPYRFLTELRFRQSKLRSFSPSNVWVQQAYAAWTTPVDGLTVSGGLLYNQLGLFWDRSWFGNLPYLNGHKLDPDMNLEMAFHRELSKAVRLRFWIQGSPGDDGLNGTFATARKLDRLILPADVETAPGYREAVALRVRVSPTILVGGVALSPGVSLQLSGIDRAASPTVPEATGTQRVGGVDLSVSRGRGIIFAEALRERLSDLGTPDIDRRFVLAGGEFTLRSRDGEAIPTVRLGASYQTTEYPDEGFDEWFATARIHVRLGRLLGTTVEYVRWELSDSDDAELDRLEMILHVYY